MTFYRLISYLRFLGASTNQHGVHSPFVYKFITQGLYIKFKKTSSKTLTVLLKSIAYFKPSHMFIESDALDASSLVTQKHAAIKIGKTPYDVVYFQNLKDPLLYEIVHGPHIHNDTMILIDGLYTNRESNACWKKIKEWNKVKVSIDLFYCGLIFVRQDQAKEHFKIRI